MLHGFIACVPDPDRWLRPHANAVGLESLGETPGHRQVPYESHMLSIIWVPTV